MAFLADAQKKQLIADLSYCQEYEGQRWCFAAIIAFFGLRENRFLIYWFQNFPFAKMIFIEYY